MIAMSNGYFQDGAAESCPTIKAGQELTPRCGENRPVEAESEFRTAPAPAFVYFVSRGDAIKIGLTTRLAARVRELAKVVRRPVTLLGAFPCPPVSEAQMHMMFAHLALGGEWFKHDQEILDFVEEMKMAVDNELREQLKAIRNSDHPARGPARNLIQIMDEVTMGNLTAAEAAQPMQAATIQFHRAMKGGQSPAPRMTATEIVEALGLGRSA